MYPLIIFLIIIYMLSGLKNISYHERIIVFTLWKYNQILQPWLRFIWPIFQSHHRIDTRKKIEEISAELDKYYLPLEIKTKILNEIKWIQDYKNDSQTDNIENSIRRD